MIRRYLARRKMRWAVRWIRENRVDGYQLQVTRIYGELLPLWNINWKSEAVFAAEAIVLLHAQD